MSQTDESKSNSFPSFEPPVLPGIPPFIWPEPRIHAGHARYKSLPPFEPLLAEADLISGVLIDIEDRTIQWLDTLMRQDGHRRVVLVIVVYPAGPTREDHLRNLMLFQTQFCGGESQIDLRLLPVSRVYGDNYEKMTFPPTVLQAHDSCSNKTTLCIGSTGDAGREEIGLASFNVVFRPDDGLRDSWRRWFQYLFSSAVPLTEDTVHIPHLVPAKGDPTAAAMWKAFEEACLAPQVQIAAEPSVDTETDEVIIEVEVAKPSVDTETGEVTNEVDNREVRAWDDGKTALDPLAKKLQQFYAQGNLVTVDETSRVKPLAIPVKAALLGQQSERTIGSLKQKQSFTLQVLDETVAKSIEKCRRVTDLISLLTYQLSLGNRWIPETARNLLDEEIEAQNKKGQELLKNALGGDDVPEFIAKRHGDIRSDLNAMYHQLSQGTVVPEDRFKTVLAEVCERLEMALDVRIAPLAIYNPIASPDLTDGAPEENWSQPLSLLIRSARLLRESFTNTYFLRRFKDLSFSEKVFRASMDVFGDVIVREPDLWRAQEELEVLQDIEDGSEGLKEKCAKVWQIITGEHLPKSVL